MTTEANDNGSLCTFKLQKQKYLFNISFVYPSNEFTLNILLLRYLY